MNIGYLTILVPLVVFLLDAVERLSGWVPSGVFYVWILSYALVVGTVIFWLVRHLAGIRSWSLVDWLTNIGAVAVFAFIFIPLSTHLALPTSVHPEASRQVWCGYQKFHESLGKFMYSWCFLGYNTRQYIPQALVREFFGAGPVQLNIVYLGYLLVGYLAFWLGLEKARQRGFGGSLLLLTALILPLQSYFYFFLTYANEQSVFPITLTLLLVGSLLMFAQSKSVWSFGVVLIVLQWLLFSYTPAVSVYFLGIALLVLVVWALTLSVSRRVIIAGALVLWSIASFAISLAHRNDIKLGHENRPSFQTQFLETYQRLLGSLFSDSTFADLVHSNRYSMVVIAAAFCVLLMKDRRVKFFALLVAGWSVANILVAAYSRGYAAPPVPFSLHRAVPVLPVWSVVVFFGIGFLRGKLPRAVFAAACLAILVLHGFLAETRSASFQRRVAETRASIPITSGELFSDLNQLADVRTAQFMTIGMFFENTHSVQVFPDVASFFLPMTPWTRTPLPTVPAQFKTDPTFRGIYLAGKEDEAVCDTPATDASKSFVIIKKLPLEGMTYASKYLVACVYGAKVSQSGEVAR